MTSHHFERPLRIEPNPVPRSTFGCGRLLSFISPAAQSANAGEDWLASTVRPRHARGDDATGLGHVELDGSTRLVRDLLEIAPASMLGDRHRKNHGTSLGVLVKWLCPDARIPIHCHPTLTYARTHLSSRYGKTESWLVISRDESQGSKPNAWIGLHEDVSEHEFAALVEGQDGSALLQALHPFELNTGDVALVPAGVPHAVGPGLLIIEPQEQSDWSFLLEWDSYDLDLETATCGIGLKTALEAFDLTGLDREEAERRFIRRGALSLAFNRPILPPPYTHYFDVRQFSSSQATTLPSGDIWTGIVVSGEGEIGTPNSSLSVARGDAFLVPATCNFLELQAAGNDDLVVAGIWAGRP